MPQLAGRTALVTGAASGIGLAVARRFEAEGATVWSLDADADALAAAGASRPVVADIADLGAVEAAFDLVEGRLDIVVANAAVQLIGRDARLGDVAPEVWQQTVDVNLTGTFHTLRAAVRRMLAQPPRTAERGSRGSIIVTGSPTGISGEGAGFAAYSATKAGAHGLARTAAMDYAADGIRVNVVVPGHTLTPLVATLRADAGVAATIDARIPLGRPAQVEEITGAYVHLASADATYTTGATYVVDGGMLL